MSISEILNEVQHGNFQCAYDNNSIIQDTILRLLDMPDNDIKNNPIELDNLISVIAIGNILYNYSDADVLPIEDGIYDLLVVKLQRIDYDKFTPGAKPVIDMNPNSEINNIRIIYNSEQQKQNMIKPFTMVTEKESMELEEKVIYHEICQQTPYDERMYMYKPFVIDTGDKYITKRIREVPHNYPNLVGTLEKCKFVLDTQAKELGVYNEPNVKIFERDFIAPLFEKGILTMDKQFSMIGTLKYDGVSIEADVTDHIIAARTRGDTDYNVASDVTPIFEGYTFPNAAQLELDKPIGMKFEAIVRYDDLRRMNSLFGTTYINGRTAIIGILASSDGWKYRDYITLVPLQVDFGDMDIHLSRYFEIEFLNKYYATREYLRYVLFQNKTYVNMLYCIKNYVQDAELLRTWGQFMYDGVVIEFEDEKTRKILGRKNSINQYAMAIKFNPLKRVTIFTGWTYTVGQNGAITPMIHYNSVEFMGSIHTKSSGSSYERFTNLDLRIGDEIYVTYVNDVMPYVSKVESNHNTKNHNKPIMVEEMFPTRCPCCGTKLEMSSGGKSMMCPNLDCSGRKKQRLSNMLAKLDIRDFSEASVEVLGHKSLYEMMNMSVDDLKILGPTDSIKLYNQLQDLIKNPLPDYRVIGALGFTNIAAKKWKPIFSNCSLMDLFKLYKETGNETPIMAYDGKTYDTLEELISNIRGVGPITAKVIMEEFPYFEKDIEYIILSGMYKPTVIGGTTPKYKIRFSGFRDPELEAELNEFPFIECDQDSSVTKDTTLLLVPHTSAPPTSKVSKAVKYGVPVVGIEDFLDNPSRYIPEIDFVEI